MVEEEVVAPTAAAGRHTVVGDTALRVVVATEAVIAREGKITARIKLIPTSLLAGLLGNAKSISIPGRDLSGELSLRS